MENYWEQLKEHLKIGAEKAAEKLTDGSDGNEIFRIDAGDNSFRLSLIHGRDAAVKLTVTKSERSIDLHTVLANGKEISGSFDLRDGYLASVNSDSIYFADAGHAAGNFLKPATDAVHDPPFNKPRR